MPMVTGEPAHRHTQQSVDNTQGDSMANKPIKRFAVGNGIRASIWANQSKHNGGSWHSVTITRTYRDGDEYKDTTSFRRDDLLFVAKASELAFAWCLEQAKARTEMESHE
jgi:hypothetical protein